MNILIKSELGNDRRRFRLKECSFSCLCYTLTSIYSLYYDSIYSIFYLDNEQEWITLASTDDLKESYSLCPSLIRIKIVVLDYNLNNSNNNINNNNNNNIAPPNNSNLVNNLKSTTSSIYQSTNNLINNSNNTYQTNNRNVNNSNNNSNKTMDIASQLLSNESIRTQMNLILSGTLSSFLPEILEKTIPHTIPILVSTISQLKAETQNNYDEPTFYNNKDKLYSCEDETKHINIKTASTNLPTSKSSYELSNNKKQQPFNNSNSSNSNKPQPLNSSIMSQSSPNLTFTTSLSNSNIGNGMEPIEINPISSNNNNNSIGDTNNNAKTSVSLPPTPTASMIPSSQPLSSTFGFIPSSSSSSTSNNNNKDNKDNLSQSVPCSATVTRKTSTPSPIGFLFKSSITPTSSNLPPFHPSTPCSTPLDSSSNNINSESTPSTTSSFSFRPVSPTTISSPSLENSNKENNTDASPLKKKFRFPFFSSILSGNSNNNSNTSTTNLNSSSTSLIKKLESPEVLPLETIIDKSSISTPSLSNQISPSSYDEEYEKSTYQLIEPLPLNVLEELNGSALIVGDSKNNVNNNEKENKINNSGEINNINNTHIDDSSEDEISREINNNQTHESNQNDLNDLLHSLKIKSNDSIVILSPIALSSSSSSNITNNNSSNNNNINNNNNSKDENLIINN